MATKAYKKENLGNMVFNNTKLYGKNIGLKRSMTYANDGLKPVVRALAYAVYQKTKGSKKGYVASQDVCSYVIGNYHPHGMDAVYEAGVKVTMDRGSILSTTSSLYSISKEGCTAPRYTNLGLSPLGKELFSTIHLCEMVKSELDQDMPETLLARFPYQLMTYNVNIGVGTSNNQLPLNPKEVIEAMALTVENKVKGMETTTEELMDIIKGPDLREGATIYTSKESLKHLIENGTGYAVEVCDVDVIPNKGEIHIKEIPYRENSQSFTADILDKSNNFHDKNNDVVEMQKISGIIDEVGSIKDLTGDEKPLIVIKVDTKSGYTTDHVLNELYNKTNLKRAHSMKYIMVDETGEKLHLYSVKDLIEKSINVNLMYFEDLYKRELDRLKNEFDINIVLEKLTREAHTDFIGSSFYKKNKVDLLLNREGLDLTIEEITEIVFKEKSILRRLSDRDIILKEIAEYEGKRNEILSKLTHENLLQDTLKYIKGTLYNIVKDMTRLSRVVYSELSRVTPKPRIVEIPDEKIVFISKNNMISAIPNEGQSRDELVGEDIKQIFYLNEKESVVVVTEKNHYRIGVSDLGKSLVPITSYGIGIGNCGNKILAIYPQKKESDDSKTWYFINNYGSVKTVRDIQLHSKAKITKSTIIEDDERIIDVFSCRDEDIKDLMIVIVTKLGYVKLIPLNIYNPKNRESKYNKSMNLEDNDEVIFTGLIKNDFSDTSLSIQKQDEEIVVVELKKGFIKPVLNKGIRVIDKKDEVMGVVLEVPEEHTSSMITRINDGTSFNYTDIFE